MNTLPLRAGTMIRVVNPRSDLYGATGHIIGRTEFRDDYWLVRFAALGKSVLMVDEELEAVRRSARVTGDE